MTSNIQNKDESEPALSITNILCEDIQTDEGLTFSVSKSTSCALWQPTLGLAQVVKLRGNFWRKLGFSINGVNFLYPEETLLLYEKQQLALSKQSDSIENYMNKEQVYDCVLNAISLSAYLAYFKLKSLDYIPMRHNKIINVFNGDEELQKYLIANPTMSLLDAMVAYDVFVENENFSKKLAKETQPASYVIITDGLANFSPRVLLSLLQEAGEVPIIIAAVTPTGHVLFEEFTDAEHSLQLSVKKKKSSTKKRTAEEITTNEVNANNNEEESSSFEHISEIE